MFSPVIKLPIIEIEKVSVTQKKENGVVLFFDGCCKGNPGPGGAGAVLYKNGEEIWNESCFVGQKVTNNVAEYTGLIIGMKQAVNLGIKSLIVNGDSLLIIRQMKGEFKVSSENLQELYKTAKTLEKSFNTISYNHVYRKGNKRADALSNEGLAKNKEAILM
jgi:ribonuclease HI